MGYYYTYYGTINLDLNSSGKDLRDLVEQIRKISTDRIKYTDEKMVIQFRTDDEPEAVIGEILRIYYALDEIFISYGCSDDTYCPCSLMAVSEDYVESTLYFIHPSQEVVRSTTLYYNYFTNKKSSSYQEYTTGFFKKWIWETK